MIWSSSPVRSDQVLGLVRGRPSLQVSSLQINYPAWVLLSLCSSQLGMAPPHDGNEYLPFADMIALEKINENTFRSIAKPFSPGSRGRAYGGHVYCQAAWAAAHTVEKGFVIHVSW